MPIGGHEGLDRRPVGRRWPPTAAAAVAPPPCRPQGTNWSRVGAAAGRQACRVVDVSRPPLAAAVPIKMHVAVSPLLGRERGDQLPTSVLRRPGTWGGGGVVGCTAGEFPPPSPRRPTRGWLARRERAPA